MRTREQARMQSRLGFGTLVFMADEKKIETNAAAPKSPRTLSEGDISLTRSRLAGSVSHVGAAGGEMKKLAGKPAEIGDPDAH